MATTAARGTKRTCQSDECGSRFYDLNRDPIVCPICGSIYAMTFGAPRTFGMVAPVGGLSFMLGWACLALHAGKAAGG